MGRRSRNRRKHRKSFIGFLLFIIFILIIPFSITHSITKMRMYSNDNSANKFVSSKNNAKSQEATSSEKTAMAKSNYTLARTTYLGSNNKLYVNNLSDMLILVNKDRNLPSTYVPDDLVTPDIPCTFSADSSRYKMQREASEAIEELFEASMQEGIKFYAACGYRSYTTQKSIFEKKANTVGEKNANNIIAYPGQSEHQTGLALDITCANASFELDEKFETTEEGIWLKENCYKYGFIIRYPKDKVNITKYSYEPWHLRYVGKDAAKYIHINKITLEEFFNLD